MKKLRRVLDILVILYIAFVGMFALDVFGQGYGFFELIVAFLIHLTPVYVLIVVFLVAKKRAIAGSLLFTCLGIYYLAISSGGPIASRMIIAGPVFTIAVLYTILSFAEKRR